MILSHSKYSVVICGYGAQFIYRLAICTRKPFSVLRVSTLPSIWCKLDNLVLLLILHLLRQQKITQNKSNHAVKNIKFI